MTTKDEIIPRNVEEEMRESYLRYSMSVIISRALPDVRDGLKPSQRRILYAMRQLNLSPGGKHRKCAKISGDTSGDYHPHGEQVIYPTLVRMAQEWVMRYPLIDGQGNFGSIDGDPPAAMRYTGARLTHPSLYLMDDLDKETVDLVPNYDETKKEPVVFPAKFPNLLCNGSSGIAVGMATNIPPHNVQEVIQGTLFLLENPLATIEDLMKFIPGPDFPTGGMICGYRGIKEAYHKGRGKLTLRAVIHVEEPSAAQTRTRIVVDELPYNVNKARLIEHIADLVNEKTITGIADVRDESDKDGMRIVFDLKKGEVPEVIINQLYRHTDLETTFGCIMLALDKGLPRTMNIKHILSSWIDHRIDVVRKRTRFELKKAEARAHILEGYLKAIDVLDDVVHLIRASQSRDEAKKQLIEQFSFTDRQAHAVLDLRLYQLTALEKEKIDDEYQTLLKKIQEYRAILADEALVREVIREELLEIKKNDKSSRKTQIVPLETEMQMEDLIAKESVIITISGDDYVKRMPIHTFKEQRRGGQGVAGMQLKKEDDVLKRVYVASTHDYLMIFTNLGRCYWLKVWQIPEAGRKSKGKPLIQLLEDLREGEKIAAILCVDGFQGGAHVFLATKQGTVKKTALTEFSNPRRKGIWAISLDEGDELMAASLVSEGEQVMLFTYKGMAIRFDESKVRPMGRTARGVRGASLKDKEDKVIGCEVVHGDETILVVCENGFGKRSHVQDFRQTNRGGVGVRSIVTSERNGNVVAALTASDENGLLLMSAAGQTVRIPASDLRVMGRNTQGVKLVNLKESDVLVAVQKLEKSQEDETKPEGEHVEETAQNGASVKLFKTEAETQDTENPAKTEE